MWPVWSGGDDDIFQLAGRQEGNRSFKCIETVHKPRQTTSIEWTGARASLRRTWEMKIEPTHTHTYTHTPSVFSIDFSLFYDTKYKIWCGGKNVVGYFIIGNKKIEGKQNCHRILLVFYIVRILFSFAIVLPRKGVVFRHKFLKIKTWLCIGL